MAAFETTVATTHAAHASESEFLPKLAVKVSKREIPIHEATVRVPEHQ